MAAAPSFYRVIEVTELSFSWQVDRGQWASNEEREFQTEYNKNRRLFSENSETCAVSLSLEVFRTKV